MYGMAKAPAKNPLLAGFCFFLQVIFMQRLDSSQKGYLKKFSQEWCTTIEHSLQQSVGFIWHSII